MQFKCLIVSLAFIHFGFAFEIQTAPQNLPVQLEEKSVETQSKINLAYNSFEYRTVAGNIVLKDDKDKDRVSISYTAYFVNNSKAQRPITFCFNGGPGAGSVWLNFGCFGPKSVITDSLKFYDPPYQLQDNPDTLLNVTDLVFVDPVPAGFSSIPSGQDPLPLYNVEEDVKLMSDAVKRLTSIFQRWDSPKYLVGESYGGMRVVKMGNHLHDEGYYLNGLILISPALDMQTILSEKGNDLPYILFLPTFAAAAKYHFPTDESLQNTLEKAEEFAIRHYSVALLLGQNLDDKNRSEIVDELADLTHLSPSLISRSNLRIKQKRFLRELLRDKGQIIGCFDSRVLGLEDPSNELQSGYDPSFEAVFGVMTASFTQYLLKDLKWPELKNYKALVPLSQWNWGKGNQYASAMQNLQDLLILNPKLRVFVATGIYDLAVPYFATEYSLAHLEIPSKDRNRIVSRRYPAGHMMYFDLDLRKKLREEMDHIFK